LKKIIILYMPVLHAGYLKFLKKYKNADTLYILGPKLTREFTFLEKEIRQVDPVVMKKVIESTGIFRKVEILTHDLIKKLRHLSIITANENITLRVVKKYFPGSKLTVDTIFLRWDEKNIHTKKPAEYDRISDDPFDREMILIAEKEAEKGSCWWRRVGAVLVKNEKIVLMAHNQHMPSEHTPYVIGDPRDFVKAGTSSEIATAIHCEQQIIAMAAKETGIGMEGALLYVTDFPCPMCAKEIAHTGIRKCFFKKGHASLNGVEILKAKKIELILVK